MLVFVFSVHKHFAVMVFISFLKRVKEYVTITMGPRTWSLGMGRKVAPLDVTTVGKKVVVVGIVGSNSE